MLKTSTCYVSYASTSREYYPQHRGDTIDSLTLLKMVNEARKLCSEKPVRNNDFIARVKDELDGEGYEIFVTPMDKKKVERIR